MEAIGAAGGDDAVSVLVAELSDPEIDSRQSAIRRLYSTGASGCSHADRIVTFATVARKPDRRRCHGSAHAPARGEHRIGGSTTVRNLTPMDSMVEN
jgi:hypothetical protein